MANKNYLIGVNLLNNGFYGKAIGYFRKEVNSEYRVQCLKGIIFSLVLGGKTEKAKKIIVVSGEMKTP